MGGGCEFAVLCCAGLSQAIRDKNWALARSQVASISNIVNRAAKVLSRNAFEPSNGLPPGMSVVIVIAVLVFIIGGAWLA